MSPGRRARTKNWTFRPFRSGKLARGRTRKVTKPFVLVACSGGVDVSSGVERRNTSAPRTTNPRVSDTRNLALIVVRRDRTGFGVKRTLSMMRRVPAGPTLEAGIDRPPPGRLMTPAGPAPWMTALGADVAVLEPVACVAVTTTLSVRPTSADVKRYVCAVAPTMLEQPPPFWSQRCHWYANVIGPVPDHEPGLAVSVSPSRGVPEIVGGDVFEGPYCCSAAVPAVPASAPPSPTKAASAAATTATSPTASTARSLDPCRRTILERMKKTPLSSFSIPMYTP